jgi:hypothetical protein
MSLTQLQAYYQPWLNKWPTTRDLAKLRIKTEKQIKTSIKKAKSKSIATVRKQYYLSSAFADVRIAARHNEDIAITMLILAFVIGYSSAAMSLNLLITAFNTAFVASDAMNINPGIFILIAGSTLGILCGWLLSFVMNMQSIALMDGAVRKIRRSVRSTIRTSLRYTTRVTEAWVLFFCILLGIPGLGALSAASYLSLTDTSMNQLLTYIPYGITAAIAWIVIMLMEYSLLPYIALFEPTVPLRQLLTRSTQLISRRGRIFILALQIILGLSLFGAYQLSKYTEQLFRVHQGLQFFSYSFVILLLANSIMVMLYRKRKLARTN